MYDCPGFTGGCVMNGTPSMSFGSSRPWKWIAVDSGSLLCRMTRTRSPSRHADLRTGNLIVVRPRLDHLARLGFPLDLLRGELEDLHAVVHLRRQQLIALAGGLGGERLDALLVHRVHRVGRGRRARAGGGVVRAHRAAGLAGAGACCAAAAFAARRLARGRDAGHERRDAAVAKESAAAGRLVEKVEARMYRTW